MKFITSIIFIFYIIHIFGQDAIPFATIDYKYGIVNRKGKVLVQPDYDVAMPQAEGLILLKRLKDLKIVDTSNALLTFNRLKFNGSVLFDFGEINSSGLPIIIRIYECTYFDCKGRSRITLSYPDCSDAFNFSNGKALIKKGLKYNVIDTSGSILFKKWYDFIGSFNNGLALVGQGVWHSWGFDGRFGYIDPTGTERIPLRLEQATDFTFGMAKVSFGEFEAIIDTNGNVVRKMPRANPDNFRSRLSASSDNSGKYQLMGTSRSDFVKKKHIDPYEILQPQNINEKWGYFDQTGAVRIPNSFDYAMNFSEGMAAVKFENKWNFINSKGKVLCNEWFDDVEAFNNGIAKVTLNHQHTYIDKTGRQLFYPIFPVMSFSGNRAKIEDASGKERKYAYLNENGLLVTQWLNGAEKFIDGLAEIKREDGLYATIDTIGNIVEDWHFRVLFKSDLFDLLECNNLYTFRDLKGRMPYAWAEDFNIFPEGRIAVMKGGKWGYIDKYGKVLMPFEYDECWNYTDGVAMVRKAKQLSFINKNGHNITNEWFDASGGFHEERAAVMKNKKWGYIDNTGKQIVKYTYNKAGNYTNGLALVRKGSKYGYIDRTGKVVINYVYSAAGNFNNQGYATVKKGKKGGRIDMRGNFYEK